MKFESALSRREPIDSDFSRSSVFWRRVDYLVLFLDLGILTHRALLIFTFNLLKKCKFE